MDNNKKYILAIESSCDDTSVSIIDTDFVCLSNITATQKIHSEYGGVVPESASRQHEINIVPTVIKALKQAGDFSLKQMSAIAVTTHPGLLGSLLVGVSFAKGLALSLNIPLIASNHLSAHVLAHFVKRKKEDTTIDFPFLCLLVSGGNTQIILVKSYKNMEIIGQTIDDAAGECLDKSAKILGLPYPGGPQIDKLAKTGNPNALKLSKANIPAYDYSFSGLKTSILYTLRDKLKEDSEYITKNINDICASVQQTVIDTLLIKFEKAIKDLKIKNIALAGGVSANSLLRERFLELGKKYNIDAYIPPFEYTTDNAAMVGAVGVFKYLNNDFDSIDVQVHAR